MLRKQISRVFLLATIGAGALLPAWLTVGAAQPTSAPLARSQTCSMVGTDGVDILIGTPGRDIICGLGGNDLIVGGSGRDVLIGGSGKDTFMTRDGVRDVIRGGPGDDLVVQRDVFDRLAGVESNSPQS